MSLIVVPGEDGDDMFEIDGAAPPKKIPKIDENANDSKSHQVCFKQPPIISSVFADPETEQMKCLVIVSLFSNIRNIDFDIIQSENGQVLMISYEWPSRFVFGSRNVQKGWC